MLRKPHITPKGDSVEVTDKFGGVTVIGKNDKESLLLLCGVTEFVPYRKKSFITSRGKS